MVIVDKFVDKFFEKNVVCKKYFVFLHCQKRQRTYLITKNFRAMNLYEITVEQMNLNNLLEESYGELTPELEEALKINKENLVTKAEGYAKAIKNYKAEQDALAEEIKKLQAKKKVCENAIARMKDALSTAMDTFDMPKVQAGLFKISLSKSESVNIIDEDAVPMEYKKATYTVSKTDIKNAIDGGLVVKGVEIKENKSVTIR